MVGGGLISLLSYGSQNVILSGRPEMTFWYKAFRRYSHFATESVSTALEGQNELFFDQPIKLRAKIQRVGDLLGDMYFSFRIPDIFSKHVVGRPEYEYKWARFLGAAIVQNAAFFVGGQKIQEFDGTYLIARALLDLDTGSFKKWQTLVGDTPELTEPEKGAFAGRNKKGEKKGYPTVIASNGQGVPRPSIQGQEIHVPLGFWFCESTHSALPLIALQYHECEVQITLQPIQNLYTILDREGSRLAPLYKSETSRTTPNQPEFTTSNDSTAEWKHFATNLGEGIPGLNGWFLNPRIQSTYIYLPDDDRKVFATQQLSYVFHQVTQYPFLGIYTRQILDIYTRNPITRLIFVPRRSDTLQYKNAYENFTNWSLWPEPPVLLRDDDIITSGTFMNATQEPIIRNLRVLADGNELQEEKPIDYFTKVVPYKTLRGASSSLLPVYNFALQSPGSQPTGSINASRIKNFQIEVDVWPLPLNTPYVYNLSIYVESINFFEVASGTGGVKYAL